MEYTFTFLLIINVITFVLSSIGPRESSATFHFVVNPGANEHSAVRPVVGSVTLNVVVFEVAVVCAAIGPGESALAMLLSVDIVSIIFGAIWPRLNTLSMLLVLLPVSFVLGSIEMAVNSVSMCLIVEPHTVINVTIGVDKPSLSIGFVVSPPAFIHRTIWPNLFSFTSSHICLNQPLSLELGLVLQYLLSSEFELIVVDSSLVSVIEFSKLLSDLDNFNILVISRTSWRDNCMSVKEAAILLRVSQSISGEHSTYTSLEFDHQKNLLGPNL